MAKSIKTDILTIHHLTDFCKVSNLALPFLEDFYCYRIQDVINNKVNKSMVSHKSMFYQFTLITNGLQKIPGLSSFVTSDSAGLLWISTAGSILSWDIPEELDGYVLLCSEKFLFEGRSSVKTLTKFPFLEEGTKLALSINAEQQAIFTALYSQILKEQLHLSSDSEEILNFYIQILLHQSKRIYELNPQIQLQEKEDRPHVIVNRFKKLISVHLDMYELGKPPKTKLVNEYAQDLHIHPNYLNELVQKVLGKSPSTLIKERTIEKSKLLLSSSDLNISQISIALGFETTAYFSTFFKKSTGYTPSEYRKFLKL